MLFSLMSDAVVYLMKLIENWLEYKCFLMGN